MIKKYFKYILFMGLILFNFSKTIYAKAEIVNINVTEIKSNYCEYSYDGLTIKLLGTYDGKLEKKIEGSSNSYNDYNADSLNNASYINNRTCPKIYTYLYTMAPAVGTTNPTEKKVLYFFYNQSDATPVFNTTINYLTTLEGSLKRMTIACSYKMEGETFIASYNPLSNKMNYSNQSTMNDVQIKSSAKKNWNYNANGLVCKEDIIIDICPYVQGPDYHIQNRMTVRSKEDQMVKDCTKSTDSGSVKITEASDSNSKNNLVYLSNICEEDTNVMKIFKFIGYLLVIVKILIPIGLIIIGIVNFSKAMISGNDDSIKKNAQSFAWKIVFAVIIFVLPTLINFIVGIIDGATDGTDDYINCRNCIFDPKNCRIP